MKCGNFPEKAYFIAGTHSQQSKIDLKFGTNCCLNGRTTFARLTVANRPKYKSDSKRKALTADCQLQTSSDEGCADALNRSHTARLLQIIKRTFVDLATLLCSPQCIDTVNYAVAYSRTGEALFSYLYIQVILSEICHLIVLLEQHDQRGLPNGHTENQNRQIATFVKIIIK